MSDTPTSVSLSKTPAARLAPITDTHAHSIAHTVLPAGGTTRARVGRISSDFSTAGDRERSRCYVKL